MDKNVTKITKKRLSDFLAYEWILIIFLCVVAVIGVNLVYRMTSVSLTVGQQFKIYYDYDLYYGSAQVVSGHIESSKALSFDVQEFTYECLLEGDDVLYARTSTYDGDLIISTDKVPGENDERKTVLAKSRVDAYDIYTYDQLYKDARAYLLTLKKDSVTIGENQDIKYEDLDEQKIEQGFNKRLGKDNRFRKSKKQEGIALEKQRIEKLCVEVQEFKKILDLSGDYFFNYTKFEQRLATAKAEGNERDIKSYQEAYDAEKAVRENARYGLRVDMLAKHTNDSKKDVTEVLRVDGDEPSSANIVIMVFNFREHQPELQFETISAINSIVRSFSTILD